MFGIDHGQPGTVTLPVTLDTQCTVGSRSYAAWAERSRLETAAVGRERETAALDRSRRRALALRRRADRAERRFRRLEAIARAH